jgi:hypothetical protein
MKLFISIPKRYDKEDIKFIRISCKKRQKKIKVSWSKENGDN